MSKVHALLTCREQLSTFQHHITNSYFSPASKKKYWGLQHSSFCHYFDLRYVESFFFHSYEPYNSSSYLTEFWHVLNCYDYFLISKSDSFGYKGLLCHFKNVSPEQNKNAWLLIRVIRL